MARHLNDYSIDCNIYQKILIYVALPRLPDCHAPSAVIHQEVTDGSVGCELTYSTKNSSLLVSMQPKSGAAIQLGMDRGIAFNLIAMIGKAVVAGKWDLPQGMPGTESDANEFVCRSISIDRES